MSGEKSAPSLEYLSDLPAVDPPRFIDLPGGHVLAWNEFGDPAGFPVMYYHGWPSSRLQAGLAHHVAKVRGLRLIAIDRPGMGQSSWQANRRLADWPPMMEHFADALKIGQFCQLGVSGGGPYVAVCAARIPNRLAGSAVLGGAVPISARGRHLRGLHPIYRLLMPLRKLPAAVWSPAFWFAARCSQLPPDRPPLTWLMASLGNADRQLLKNSTAIWPVITESFREGIRHQGARGVMADAAIYFQALGFEPHEVTHPIRYWHGGDDRNIPIQMVRDFTAQLAGGQLEVIEELGHFSLVLYQVAAALDYLATCARSVAPLTAQNTREC